MDYFPDRDQGLRPRAKFGRLPERGLLFDRGPDLIALGHGLLVFREYRDRIAHLLAELEEPIRIDTEHNI